MYENLEYFKKEIREMITFVDVPEDEQEKLLNGIVEIVVNCFEDYENSIEEIKGEYEDTIEGLKEDYEDFIEGLKEELAELKEED
jgi:hypothetical protein